MGSRESKLQSSPRIPRSLDQGSRIRTVTSSHSMPMQPVRPTSPAAIAVWPERSVRWQSQYDVYICHSEADCSYAMEMLTFLEQQPEKLRCFLPMRDMLAGSPIPSEMCSGLENSHCWVMLLTPQFLSDNWCKYQMHQFLAQAPCSNGRLIPVIIGLSFAQYPSVVKHMYAIKGAFNDPCVFSKVKEAIITYLKEMINVTTDQIPAHLPRSRSPESSPSISNSVENSLMDSLVNQEPISERTIISPVTQEPTSDRIIRSPVTQELTGDRNTISQVTQEPISERSTSRPVTQEPITNISMSGSITGQGTTSSVSMSGSMTGQRPTSDVSMSGSMTGQRPTSDVSMSGSMTAPGTTSDVSMSGSMTGQGTTSDASMSGSMTGQGTTSDVSMSGSKIRQGTTSDASMSGSMTGQGTTSDVSMSGSKIRQGTTSDTPTSGSMTRQEPPCWLQDPHSDIFVSLISRTVPEDCELFTAATKAWPPQETQDTSDSGVWSMSRDLLTDCSSYDTS